MFNLIRLLKQVSRLTNPLLIGILVLTGFAFTPAPLQTAVNVLQDPSFEAYTPNPYWTESSTNFGTPLCTETVCGNYTHSGQVWARFGGTAADQVSSLSQTIIIPKGAAILQFYLWIRFAAAGSDSADVFTVEIDGTTIFSADATQIEFYPVYTAVAVDASTYADGGAHTLAFSSMTTGQLVEFDLDDVSLTSTNSPPQSVTKWSPTDGLSAQTNVLTLSWSPSSDASSFEYCYDVTNDNNCSPWISAGFAHSVKLTRLNVNTIYYWQVRAKNALGVTYADGNTYWSFKVTDLPWSGQTNHGLPVSFQTDADRTRWSDFQINAQYTSSSGYYFDLSCDKVPYFPPGAVPIRFGSGAITNGQFYISLRNSGDFHGVFSITGQFTSAATVTGTYTFIGDYEVYFFAHTGYCTYHMNESGTWTAEIPVTHTISGNTGASGVALSYLDAMPMGALSHGDDSYSLQVSDGWSGTVTPSHPCYTFDPPSRSYSNVNTDLLDQSYIAILNPAPGCTAVGVSVGGNLLRQYAVQPHISLWADETIDNGPIKVASADGVTPILASERFLFSHKYSASYAEMMGYPGDQLATEYWFPWYNNLSYSTQLRVSNLGDNPAEVKVYVGDSSTPIDTFTLPAGQGRRVAYAGIDQGPLHVVSTDGVTPILASERFILTYLNSASYAEMMGYPGDQLATDYWFPWYTGLGNFATSTQLRVGNLGNNPVEVKIYVGNTTTPIDTFTLQARQAIRKSYQMDNGPLHVVSTDGVTPILASERFIRTDFNRGFSFGPSASYAELMGYPGDQLTTEYCFPWSSNYAADEITFYWPSSQLLISNLGTSDAAVKVYVDGFERDSVTIPGGQTAREGYFGFHNGPLCVQSTDGVTPILVSERFTERYFDSSSSYSELMGYPKDRLATSYWFPWYNNLSYSTQLRIATP